MNSWLSDKSYVRMNKMRSDIDLLQEICSAFAVGTLEPASFKEVKNMITWTLVYDLAFRQ